MFKVQQTAKQTNKQSAQSKLAKMNVIFHLWYDQDRIKLLDGDEMIFVGVAMITHTRLYRKSFNYRRYFS